MAIDYMEIIMKKTTANIVTAIVIVGICVTLFFVYMTLTETDKEAAEILNPSRQSDFVIKMDSEDYKCSVIESDSVKSPSGILVLDDKIYIVDQEMNSVLILDKQGNLLEKFGETGNGESQFLSPRQICSWKDNFFVLDSGNNRVEVFDEKFAYINSVQLNKFEEMNISASHEFGYCDITLDGLGNIYVSVLAISPQNTHIYMIDTDGIIYELGNNFVGYMDSMDDRVMFLNHKTVKTAKVSGKMSSIYAAYTNFLYQIEDGKLETIAELPFEYTPVGFTHSDTNIYMYSEKYNTLDRYTRDGEYLSTLYQFEPQSGIRYLAFDEKTESIFATSPETGKIYQIQKVQ